MWKASWNSGGGGGRDIPQPKMWCLGEPKHKHLDFWCALLNIIFSSIMKQLVQVSFLFITHYSWNITTLLAYFSLDYENCPFTKIQLVDYFAHKLYLSNTHKLHGYWLGVLYAWMNGYSTLLHNIAPGKYIVIKVEYGLQLRFKIFLKKSDRKKQQQK